MSEEEKEAIETLQFFKEKKFYTHAFDNGTLVLDDEEIEDVDIILNLIEKQQKELEKKDKIIDKMAEQLVGLPLNEKLLSYGYADKVKEYYTNLIEKESK